MEQWLTGIAGDAMPLIKAPEPELFDALPA